MDQDSEIKELKKRVIELERAEPGEKVVERVVETKEIIQADTPKHSTGGD